MTTQQLNVGFVGSRDVFDDVVTEVMNHQGVIFKIINERTKIKFPCVVLSRDTDSSYELARKHCVDEENIIIAEKEMPLNIVLKALAGDYGDSTTDLTHPAINEYEDQLLTLIRNKFYALNLPLLRKWFWPNFHKVCCILTHDIDWLYYSPWHFAAIRNKSIPHLMKLLYYHLVHRRNYGNNIPEIVTKEKYRNVRSTFFLLANYYGRKQEFLKILEILRKEQVEIGLHGSTSSYSNFYRLKFEKNTLESRVNSQIKGVRQHELNFKLPLTWQIQEKAGFLYDLTFYYTQKIGFRSGLCFPYHPIDLSTSKRFSLLEIPTSLMDWTVLSRSYSELVETLKKLEMEVEEFNGCLTMNFHNTYLNKETFPDIEKFYTYILDESKEKNHWFATAEECYSWWTKRENTRVEATFREGRIKGRTSSFPLPVTIEKSGVKEMHMNLLRNEFEIDSSSISNNGSG